MVNGNFSLKELFKDPRISYLCDRTKCGTQCNEDCLHTFGDGEDEQYIKNKSMSDVFRLFFDLADLIDANFTIIRYPDGRVIFEEREYKNV